jgi:hypothetical protein
MLDRGIAAEVTFSHRSHPSAVRATYAPVIDNIEVRTFDDFP